MQCRNTFSLWQLFRQRFFWMSWLVISLTFIFTSCNKSGDTTEASPAPSPSSTYTLAPSPTVPLSSPTPENPPPTPIVIPVAQQQIWFAPLPPMPQTEGRAFIGSEDFMDLFSPGANWTTSSNRITVFKLYGEWVAYHATDTELQTVIHDLMQRGMMLAVEAGPLMPSEVCGQGIEGFAGLGEGLLIARRIQEAGGSLDLVAMDEPYFFAHLYDGQGACHWTAEQIAVAVSEYTNGMRSVFPDIIVGDTEPLPSGIAAEEYMLWMDTYRQVTGSDLGFLHMDLDYHSPTWENETIQIEEFCRSRGIPFGIIYNGEDTSDEAWIKSAWERAGLYEQHAGGHPDHILFQSWNDHPDYVLPENTPNAFTHLINRYFRPRSRIQAEIVTDASGGTAVKGILTKETGGAVPNAPVRASVAISYQPSVLPPMVTNILEGTTQESGEFAIQLADLPAMGSRIELHYPGSEQNLPQGDAGFWPDYLQLEIGTPGRNIAINKPAVADVTLQGSDPSFAVDGNPATSWSAGDFPRHFIEIEWGEPSMVALLRLWVDQYPAGKTIQWIWGIDSQGVFHLLKEVGIVTDNWDVIEVKPDTPWEDLIAMRIEVVQSPSWVAWREIEIISP